MIFRRLSLQNFGAYAGTNEIRLDPPDPERPVILFGGQNGEGKTTILEAVRLALYGPHSMKMNGRVGAYDAYLESRIHRRAPQGEGAAVSLELDVPLDGRLRTLELTRSWRVSVGKVVERLDVAEGGSARPELSDRWADLIETIVPRGVAPLFFFDGERIEDLADLDSAAETLRVAVAALLGLELVDQLASDLLALERRHAKRAASNDLKQELAEEEQSLAEAQKQAEAAQQEVAELTARCEQAEAKVAKVEDKFAREGGGRFEQRSDLERRAEAARVRHLEAKERLRKLAASSLPLAILAGELGQLRDAGNQEQQAALARAMSDLIVQRDAELLKLEMPDDFRSKLERWLTADRENRFSTYLESKPLGIGPEALSRVEALLDGQLGAAVEEAREAIEAEQDAAHELEEAERRLAEVPTHDAIAKLLASRERARAERDELLEKLDAAREGLAMAERRLARAAEDHERVLRRIAQDDLAADESARIVQHSERARKTLRALREKAVAHHMERIEGLISESLALLMRKQGLVRRVEIDPQSFTLCLRGVDDRPIPTTDLSAGERQLVALSLLWGLARAASRQLPVIIDTPLGRLDSSHRELFVSRYLPNASHQTVVLSTDTEVDRALLPLLEGAVGRTYRLHHDDGHGATSVAPGYFFDEDHAPALAA